MPRRFLLAGASFAFVFVAASSALAQAPGDTPAAPPSTAPPPEHAVGASSGTTMAPAATTTLEHTPGTTAVADTDTDFTKIIKTIGIGYFGQFDVPLGNTVGGRGAVGTQLVGVRYFMNSRFGIDVGVGMGLVSGSNKVEGGGTSTSTDRPSTLAMSFKVGVPIVMFSSKHYSFFFEPQAIFGFAGETAKRTEPNTADTKHNGTRFFVGGSAGALVQFGFIGMPQLTLDATVGLGLDVSGGKTEQATAAGQTTVVKQSFSQTGFGSYTAHQPWNIFHTNVAAIYHF
jgi:hypothetical protein